MRQLYFIKEMTRGLDPNKTTWPYWMIEDKKYTATPDRANAADKGNTEVVLLVPKFYFVAFILNEDILV